MTNIVAPPLPTVINGVTDSIQLQMERRAFLASNELHKASQLVLRGQRGGRRYKIPGTFRRQRDKTDGKMKNGRYYTASAPGQPPAVRTGAFRMSWQPTSRVVFGSYISRIESDLSVNGYNLGSLLEDGTSRMEARPHHDRILEKAKGPILKIYNEPYF